MNKVKRVIHLLVSSGSWLKSSIKLVQEDIRKAEVQFNMLVSSQDSDPFELMAFINQIWNFRQISEIIPQHFMKTYSIGCNVNENQVLCLDPIEFKEGQMCERGNLTPDQ